MSSPRTSTIRARSRCFASRSASAECAPCRSTSPSERTSLTATSSPTAWSPTMQSDDVLDGLKHLGFRGSRDSLKALLVEATKTRSSPTETLERLVGLERVERDRRNLDRRTHYAALGTFKTVDQFDWSWPRTVDKPLYKQLCTLDFIEAGENVLLRGQSGTGKTTLSQNLGLLALQKGYRVRFSTLAGAL